MNTYIHSRTGFKLRKKSLLSAMKIVYTWACFIAIIIPFSFLNNWKWEKLDEKQNMQWNHYSNSLNFLQSLQHSIRPLFALTFVFLFESLQQQQKAWKTDYTYFVTPTCFLLIQEIRRSMTIFWLWQSWQILTFCKPLQ